MARGEFARHLRILADDDPDYLQRTWESSARFFFREAVAGRDISGALAALERVYLEATQVGAMRPAAAAIAAHALQAGDVSHLRGLLIRAKYKDWVLEGIEDAVDEGLCLEPAVELLIEFIAARDSRVRGLLVGHVRRGAEFMAIAGAVARGAPGQLGEWLKDAQAAKLDITPALPLLAAQLAAPRLAGAAAAAFVWIAELGVDLAAVVATLAARVEDADEKVSSGTAYGLAFHRAAGRAWGEVDALLASGRASARQAAGRALRVRLLGKSDDAPELVDRVAGGLLAGDVEARARSLQALLEAQRRGLRARPSAEVVARLVAALDASVAELLHAVVPAGELLALLAGVDAEPAIRLRAACRAGVVACSICTRLPRDAHWSHESDIPAEVRRLAGEAPLLRCPECGRHYVYFYSDEWEDMHRSETWSLRRLAPFEVRQRLGDAFDGAAALARLRSELGHPRAEVRAEAAFDVAAELVAAADWSGLGELASATEGEARARVLEVFAARVADVAPFVALLRDALGDRHDGVRARAGAILARRALRGGALDEVQRLLAADDRAILPTVLQEIAAAARDGFDPAPLFERLAALRGHADEAIRRPAWWMLEDLGRRPGEVDPLPLFLADLEAADAGRRSRAASAIESLAPTRPDAARALARLVAMLADDETAYHALAALKALHAARVSVEAAVPMLVERVVTPGARCRHDMLYFLQSLGRAGVALEVHYERLAALLTDDEVSRRGALQIFEDAPGGLAAVEGPLRAAVDDPEAYLREVVARLLARLFVQRHDVAGLRFLLGHARAEAASMCAEVLAVSRVDVALVPDLVALLGHRKDHVRGHVIDAIVALARDHRGAVEAALREMPESPTLARLRAKLPARS